MNNDLKEKIAQSAWWIAILAGAVVFALSYFVTTRLALWSWFVGLLVWVVLFILFAVGVWLVANNVVDAYTLDAADDAQNVYRLLDQIWARQDNSGRVPEGCSGKNLQALRGSDHLYQTKTTQ